MTRNCTDQVQNRLELRSRLSDIGQLPAWIEGLASQHSIPTDVQFAMRLCLEEVLSNIVFHGYEGKEDGSMMVCFTAPREGYIVLVVEDEAPLFNPVEAPELPALNPRDEIRVGGQGLRLLRRFAHKLEYEPTPAGNRLRIGFSTAGSTTSTKSP
jgi:serine/threonine-protein kinase RsbW